jgi:hypothetical protein
MRFHARWSLLALLTGAIVVMSASAALAAPGVERFFASNCKVSTCKKAATPAEEKANAEAEGYTQAAGHPPFGITDFKVNTTGPAGKEVPDGNVNHIRTDVAPGVSTNPEAVPKCTMAEFGTEVAPNFFLAPTCKSETEIGKNKAVVWIAAAGSDFELTGNVYNLVQQEGHASDFGVALPFPKFLSEILFKGTPLEKTQLYVHTIIEGHVEWASDYHDYFEIHVSTSLPLVSSRLIFSGNIGTGGFLTNPTSCTGRRRRRRCTWNTKAAPRARARTRRLSGRKTAASCRSSPASPLRREPLSRTSPTARR